MEYQIWEWVTTVVHKWTSPLDERFWILGCWSEVDLVFVCCFLESWPTSQYHPASYPHPAQHPSLKSMLLLSRRKSNNKTNLTGLFSRINIPWKPWSFNGFASFVPWKMGSFLPVVLTQCWDSHRTTNKNWNWLFHSFTVSHISSRLQCHHVRISTAWMWLKAGPQRGGAEMHLPSTKWRWTTGFWGTIFSIVFRQSHRMFPDILSCSDYIPISEQTSDSIEPSLWEACHRHCFGWATPLDQTGLHRLHSGPGDDGEFSNFLMGTRFLDLLQGTRSNFLMVFMVEPWKK